MARVVHNVFCLKGKNDNVVRQIEISNKGLSFESAMFMLESKNKKYKEFFQDLLFYDDLIKYMEENNLTSIILNFDNFKKKFISLFVSVRDSKPTLSKKIYQEYKSKYIKGYGLSLDVQDSFKDYEIYTIKYGIRSLIGNFVPINEYALIKEFADKLYDLTVKSIKEYTDPSNIIQIIFQLLMAQKFYLAYHDKFDDKESVEYLNKLEPMIENARIKFPIDYRTASICLVSNVQPTDSIYFNVEKFIQYILKKFYDESNINALEMVRSALMNADSDKDNNLMIVDCFSGILVNQNLIDEYNAFLNMRNTNENNFIVNRLLYYFYQYYPTPKYQEMLATINGEQRTQS